MRNLATQAHPVWVKSFWLVVSLGSGLLAGAILPLVVSPRWSGLAVAIGLASALPALLRPETVAIPYRMWNTMILWYVRLARAWVALVCFFTIFTIVGRAGSALRLNHPSGRSSLWVPFETGTETDHRGVTVEDSSNRSWVPAFLSWAARTGNWWAYSLLPFLVLMSALEPERERSTVPTSIYTLY